MPHHFPALFLFTYRTDYELYHAMSYHDNLTLERLTCRCHELLETQSPHTPTNIQALEAVGSFRTIEAQTDGRLEEAAKAFVDFLEDYDFSEPLDPTDRVTARKLLEKLAEALS